MVVDLIHGDAVLRGFCFDAIQANASLLLDFSDVWLFIGLELYNI